MNPKIHSFLSIPNKLQTLEVHQLCKMALQFFDFPIILIKLIKIIILHLDDNINLDEPIPPLKFLEYL